MKTNISNLLLLSALIAVLNLLPAGHLTAQSFTTLHSFTAGRTNSSGVYTNSDGANPVAGLITNSSGNTLYGTTVDGGSSGHGTVFAVNTDGTGFTNLHSFNYSDGANPGAGLILSGNTLYGTAYNGGSSGYGTVFAINTDGTGFTILHGFTKNDCNLACRGSNDFFDCASCGGVCVTAPNGTYYCSNSEDGSNPNAGLILSGNTLYGTTSSGGFGGDWGRGTVFAINTDGTGFTNLHKFSGGDGASPQAGLILAGDTLYGTTVGGGSWGNGTVFALKTDGTGFTNLHSFTQQIIPCLNGSCPSGYHCVAGICVPIPVGGCPGGCGPCGYCVCFVDRDGNPIGPCYCAGGGPGCGPVASPGGVPESGVTAQTFISINLDGANPMGGLILLNDTLYGTAFTGGYSDAGTVFAVHTDGTGFTILHSFTGGSDGANPKAGLILAGNTLYGTAYAGGSSGLGTVFAVNTDGTGFTNLYSFTGASDGANPVGGLIISSNTLHGTARYGGTSGNGTVFSLSLPPLPPVAHCKHVTVSADVSCTADASIDDGSFSPNAGGTITLAQSASGPYPLGDTSVTLTVTDSHGASNSCVATVTVVDTTPPVITCPGNIVADATSPAGAVVRFAPTASDNCSVASVSCSPTSGSTFAIGDTTVTCTATDAAGNWATCTFTVHVKGAAEQINNLLALVPKLGLPSGTANSLSVKLQGAAGGLDRANLQAACGNLGAFLNEVNAQTGKKLTAAQADLLIAEATRIRAVLGCN